MILFLSNISENNLAVNAQNDSVLSSDEEFQDCDGSFVVPGTPSRPHSKLAMRKEIDESLDQITAFPSNLVNSTISVNCDDTMTKCDGAGSFDFTSSLNITDKEKYEQMLMKTSNILDRTIEMSKNELELCSSASISNNQSVNDKGDLINSTVAHNENSANISTMEQNRNVSVKDQNDSNSDEVINETINIDSDLVVSSNETIHKSKSDSDPTKETVEQLQTIETVEQFPLPDCVSPNLNKTSNDVSIKENEIILENVDNNLVQHRDAKPQQQERDDLYNTFKENDVAEQSLAENNEVQINISNQPNIVNDLPPDVIRTEPVAPDLCSVTVNQQSQVQSKNHVDLVEPTILNAKHIEDAINMSVDHDVSMANEDISMMEVSMQEAASPEIASQETKEEITAELEKSNDSPAVINDSVPSLQLNEPEKSLNATSNLNPTQNEAFVSIDEVVANEPSETNVVDEAPLNRKSDSKVDEIDTNSSEISEAKSDTNPVLNETVEIKPADNEFESIMETKPEAMETVLNNTVEIGIAAPEVPLNTTIEANKYESEEKSIEISDVKPSESNPPLDETIAVENYQEELAVNHTFTAALNETVAIPKSSPFGIPMSKSKLKFPKARPTIHPANESIDVSDYSPDVNSTFTTNAYVQSSTPLDETVIVEKTNSQNNNATFTATNDDPNLTQTLHYETHKPHRLSKNQKDLANSLPTKNQPSNLKSKSEIDNGVFKVPEVLSGFAAFKKEQKHISIADDEFQPAGSKFKSFFFGLFQ